jgi:hypothetical protein
MKNKKGFSISRVFLAIAHNSQIDAMTNVQLIEKQQNVFRFNINGTKANLHTKPLALFTTGLFPLKSKVKGSTLGWHIKGKWVSYNQIRIALKQAK